jgi:hypothetical protein
VFVALCDNATQSIAPVPPKIGNGDDPANNLYWGCTDGLKSCFKKSKEWKLQKTVSNPSSEIIERCIFQHQQSKAVLIADAYRGSQIKIALEHFLDSASGNRTETIEGFHAASSSSLVAYIGHNGLMDAEIAPRKKNRSPSIDAIVLCCKSDAYFTKRLRDSGSTPLLMTQQFMYPGSFILKSALEGWLQKESQEQLLDRAAGSYADNQKISVKSARKVFVSP